MVLTSDGPAVDCWCEYVPAIDRCIVLKSLQTLRQPDTKYCTEIDYRRKTGLIVNPVFLRFAGVRNFASVALQDDGGEKEQCYCF